MPRRFFIELISVADGDVVYSLPVGGRLELPRFGTITCGRVPGLDIHCRGEGQGGRRCFSIDVDGDDLRIYDLGHSEPIWVRGEPVRGAPQRLAVGDTFGPCEGIQYALRAEAATWGALHIGDYLCVAPHGHKDAPIYSAVRLSIPSAAWSPSAWTPTTTRCRCTRRGPSTSRGCATAARRSA